MSAMVVYGSVIGCKVGVRPKQQDDWTEVCNLWGLIIARPGFMKSPTVSEILRAAYHAAETAAETYAALKKEDEYEREVHKKRRADAVNKMATQFTDPEPVEPPQRRYFTNDSTYEKLCEILRDNPQGTLMYRDEVVSLLDILSGRTLAGARIFLTAWSGTQRYDTDRIGRGAIHVKFACVSILGTTQPGAISEYVRRAVSGGRGDDGLIQRFALTTWPDTSPQWKNVDRYPLKEPRDTARAVFQRLNSVTWEKLEQASTSLTVFLGSG